MVMPFFFLLIGFFVITIIFIPTIVTFSQMHENQNSNNIPFTNNSNKSQITIVTNSTLLKQLGSLYSFSTFE